MTRSVTYLSLIAAILSPICADELTDQVTSTLQDANEAYTSDVDAASTDMIDQLDTFIASAKKRGKLADVEQLVAAKTSFTERDVLTLGPTRTLKVLAVRYQYKSKKAVGKLTAAYEQAIKSYTKAGDLEQAKETEVLLRAMLGELEPEPPTDFKTIAGDWVVTFGTSGKTFSFSITPTGKHANGQIEIRNGRFLDIGDGVHQDTEYIRRGDELIVLGWTARAGRSPLYVGNNAVLSQPDHVGIARRAVK